MNKLICCALLCLVSLSAFAAGGTAKINLVSPRTVAGTQLAAGEYKLSWTGAGSDVQVTVTGQKKAVTATAKIVELPVASRYDAVVAGEDGTIRQIRFSGKKMVLAFNE